MKIFKNKKKLLKEIAHIKDIAFIPTMGSLHKGHLSLIKVANKKSKNILVSIYVNPKQFNTKSDFLKYPKNLNKDILLLQKMKIKYLYLPKFDDIFLFKPKSPIYLDQFSKKLCGKFKPGHFMGVVDIINRFIEIIKPHSILLGNKDFQQLALIRLHLKKNKIFTNIISCPTVRGDNGIALSSRNVLLNKNQIKIAGEVFLYLKSIKKSSLFKITIKKKLQIIGKILKLGVKKVDYLECINLKTLKSTKKLNGKSNLFIAYYISETRLIDNL